jgi:hypothetical protein
MEQGSGDLTRAKACLAHHTANNRLVLSGTHLSFKTSHSLSSAGMQGCCNIFTGEPFQLSLAYLLGL